MRNRFLTVLSSGVLLLSCGLISSCGNGAVTSSQTISAAEVKLNKSEIKLTIGDKTQLIATNTKDEPAQYDWRSSNENIVTVDQNGRLEAISAGEAVVSVSYGNSIATCRINVSAGLFAPSLHFSNEINDHEQVAKGGKLNLSVYVNFNGRDFDDVNAKYTVSNPEAGTVENGVFIAGNTIGASTTILVEASWRNFDSPSLRKQIEVKVISLRNIYLNNGDLGDITLFTVDHIGETKYQNSQEITSINAEEDGVEKAISSVELINNESLDDPSLPSVDFVYDAALKKGRITALRQGSASLCVSFIDGEGSVYSKSFGISVNLPILKIEETIPLFSIDDGAYFDSELGEMTSLSTLFPTGSSDITKAYQGETKLTIDGDKVLGVTSDNSASCGNASLLVYNDVMAISLRIETYQKVIDEASDFVGIFSADSKNKEIDGYYVLAKDIVNKTDKLEMPSGKYPSTFSGTFDGMGHKVSIYLAHNSAAEEWGLFGNSLKGTVTKVAFDECEMDAAFAGLISHHSEGNATIKDVYINSKVHSTSSTAAFGVLYSTYGALKVSQTIVNIPDVMESNGNKGAFGVHGLSVGSGDLYIVSPKSNGIGQTDKNKSYIYQSEADADTEFKGNKFVLSPNALWYPTFSEMNNAGNDYSSFDSDVWNLESGIPVFKGLSYFGG